MSQSNSVHNNSQSLQSPNVVDLVSSNPFTLSSTTQYSPEPNSNNNFKFQDLTPISPISPIPNQRPKSPPKSIDPTLLSLDPIQQALYLAKLSEQKQNQKQTISSSPSLDSESDEDEEEEDESKRQQRLEKNRKSAAVSRAKKKQYVVELETKLDRLNAMNEELEQKLQRLMDENANLHEKVESLQETLNKCANFSTILQDLHKLQQQTPASSNETATNPPTELDKREGNTLKAGLAKLLVFLKEMLDE